MCYLRGSYVTRDLDGGGFVIFKQARDRSSLHKQNGGPFSEYCLRRHIVGRGGFMGCGWFARGLP